METTCVYAPGSPEHGAPPEGAANLTMPRPVCVACGNTGQVIEYRLVWVRIREDQPALPCGRRVASQAEGVRQMRELGPLDLHAQVVSGAKACDACARRKANEANREKKRQAKQAAVSPEAARNARPESTRTTPVAGRRDPSTPVRDWKLAQAGDENGE